MYTIIPNIREVLMRHFFEKISWQALLTPILFILTGAVLAVWPQSSIKIICTAASLFMIGLGAICLYCYFRGRDDLFSGHVNPVSYTHLDVYKRQEFFDFALITINNTLTMVMQPATPK